ncbi:hypothetical protein JCM11491_004486 [Sporobolomyces phaffii]
MNADTSGLRVDRPASGAAADRRALVGSFNSLLAALSIPISVPALAVATPTLLLTALEAILETRIVDVADDDRASRDPDRRTRVATVVVHAIGQVFAAFKRRRDDRVRRASDDKDTDELSSSTWTINDDQDDQDEMIDARDVASGSERAVARVVAALVKIATRFAIDFEHHHDDDPPPVASPPPPPPLMTPRRRRSDRPSLVDELERSGTLRSPPLAPRSRTLVPAPPPPPRNPRRRRTTTRDDDVDLVLPLDVVDPSGSAREREGKGERSRREPNRARSTGPDSSTTTTRRTRRVGVDGTDVELHDHDDDDEEEDRRHEQVVAPPRRPRKGTARAAAPAAAVDDTSTGGPPSSSSSSLGTHGACERCRTKPGRPRVRAHSPTPAVPEEDASARGYVRTRRPRATARSEAEANAAAGRPEATRERSCRCRPWFRARPERERDDAGSSSSSSSSSTLGKDRARSSSTSEDRNRDPSSPSRRPNPRAGVERGARDDEVEQPRDGRTRNRTALRGPSSASSSFQRPAPARRLRLARRDGDGDVGHRVHDAAEDGDLSVHGESEIERFERRASRHPAPPTRRVAAADTPVFPSRDDAARSTPPPPPPSSQQGHEPVVVPVATPSPYTMLLLAQRTRLAEKLKALELRERDRIAAAAAAAAVTTQTTGGNVRAGEAC